jgi:hypothetical protein
MLNNKDIVKLKQCITSFERDHPGKSIRGHVTNVFINDYLLETLRDKIAARSERHRFCVSDMYLVLDGKYCAYCKFTISESVCRSCKKTADGHLLSRNLRRERMRATCRERHGCDFPQQIPEAKKLARKTLKDRYGVTNAAQIEEGKEKRKEWALKTYGVSSNLQTEEVLRKQKEASQRKYGTDYALQSQKGREEFESILIAKYGVRHALQNEDIKEARRLSNLERWGAENNTQLPKVINQRRSDYFAEHGVIHHMQRPEILRKFRSPKVYKVEIKGRTFECQGFERFLIHHLVKQFGVKGVWTQYRPDFPILEGFKQYTPDFYIPSRDLFVEVKSTWYLFGNENNGWFDDNRQKNSRCRKLGVDLLWVVGDKNGGEFVKLPARWDLWSKTKLRYYLKDAFDSAKN